MVRATETRPEKRRWRRDERTDKMQKDLLRLVLRHAGDLRYASTDADVSIDSRLYVVLQIVRC